MVPVSYRTTTPAATVLAIRSVLNFDVCNARWCEAFYGYATLAALYSHGFVLAV